MRITKLLFKTLLLSLVLISCGEDSLKEIIDQELPIVEGEISFKDGILISGEGSGAGSGSISFLSEDFTVLSNQIYYSINNEQLGTFLQSLAFDAENAYISVDNASTITVVDRYTFEEKGKITTDLDHPRFMTIANGKGYSTNWGTGSFGNNVDDDFIAVINLTTFLVEKTISVAVGPERILEKNGKLYVSHKGAHGTNNIVSVIDLATDDVTEITVGYKPDEMFFDASNALWVLSSGNASWTNNETKGGIVKIDITTNAIVKTFDFAMDEHPSLMTLSEGKIYYELSNEIYVMNVSATELPATSIITTTGYTYELAVKDNQLFSIDAAFTKLSKLSVYDLGTKTKTDDFNVALGASKIYFNE